MKTVTIDITKNGSTVSIDMEGFQGTECTTKTRELISSIGILTDSNYKPEYYEHEAIHV